MFDTCFEYDDHLRASGHWGGGEALQGPETALTLYWKNGKVATTDGPYAETKEQLGGILVLEARDMNHAVQLIGQHPALTYGNIFEIRPAGDMNEIIKASEQRRKTGRLHPEDGSSLSWTESTKRWHAQRKPRPALQRSCLFPSVGKRRVVVQVQMGWYVGSLFSVAIQRRESLG